MIAKKVEGTLYDTMYNTLYDDFKTTKYYAMCLLGLPFKTAFTLYLTAKGMTLSIANAAVAYCDRIFELEKIEIVSVVSQINSKPTCHYCDSCNGDCPRGTQKSAVFCPFSSP